MADELENQELEGNQPPADDVNPFAEGAEGGDGDGGEGGEGGGGEPAAPAAPAPSVVNLSPETIAAMVASMNPAKPDEAPPERPMTQEEIDQALQVFKPDENLLAELGLQPSALPAFSRAMQAVVKQAVAMSYLATKKAQMDLQRDIEPVRGYVTQARERELRNEFFEKNADLKPYEKVVEAVYAKMGNEKVRYKTVPEGFNAIREQTLAMLKSVGITPAAGSGNGGGSVAPSNAPRKMPTLSSGGRGGAAPSAVEGSKVAKTMFG